MPRMKFASFRIEQNLYHGETISTFKKLGREVKILSFVSAKEDFLILKIYYKGRKDIECKVSLELPGKKQFIDNPPFDPIFPDSSSFGFDNGISWISRGFIKDVDIASRASVAMKILGEKSNRFSLSDGKVVTVVVALSSDFKVKDSLSYVQKEVFDFDGDKVASLEENHHLWWENYWNLSSVDIGGGEVEKQYYVSNYALASCSRDIDFPPSIFGSWITKERPYWSGDYHINYNYIAPFYGLYSSNHIQQVSSFEAPLLAQIERGNYYSKKICGIEDGIMLPVGIGPLGIETTRRNSLMEQERSSWIEEGVVEDEGLFFGQKSNSAYCVVNMATHFYSTYDMEYAKRVYPFIEGVATFWENYLSYEDGRYVIYNDAIHEGTIGTMNPILSLGLVRNVMQIAIEMSSELGIQHIFPSGQIGFLSDKTLLEISRNTISEMSRWIDFNGSNSFFPSAVRCGYDADIIWSQLEKYVGNCYPNGFQKNNPHGIENLSTVPNSVNEMLCSAHQSVLRLFPDWPKGRDASFSNIRVFGAFLVSSSISNGEINSFSIFSEKGRDLVFKNPWKGKRVQISSSLQNGEDKNREMSGDLISLRTKMGEILSISSLE